MTSIHHITTPLYPARPTSPAASDSDESLTLAMVIATTLVGLLALGALTLLGLTDRLLTDLVTGLGG